MDATARPNVVLASTTTTPPNTGSLAREWSSPVRHRCRLFAAPAAEDTTALRRIRAWTKATCEQWKVSADEVDTACRVVHELAANAFAHTDSGRLGIAVALLQNRTGQICVEVSDNGRPDGAAPAMVQNPGFLWSERGRGLAMVDVLCAWDVREVVPGVPSVGHVVSAVPRQLHAA